VASGAGGRYEHVHFFPYLEDCRHARIFPLWVKDFAKKNSWMHGTFQTKNELTNGIIFRRFIFLTNGRIPFMLLFIVTNIKLFYFFTSHLLSPEPMGSTPTKTNRKQKTTITKTNRKQQSQKQTENKHQQKQRENKKKHS